MTTAGFVSGPRSESAPTSLSRLASASSFMHGLALVGVMPAATAAAPYVGVMAATTAALALLTGSVLWHRATLCARAGAGLAAGATLGVGLLDVSIGLPGARHLDRLAVVDLAVVGGFAALALVLLVLDARQRQPEQAPDHPYAL